MACMHDSSVSCSPKFSVFRPRQETIRRLGWVQSVEREGGTHSMEGVGVWRSFIKEGFKIGGGLVK